MTLSVALLGLIVLVILFSGTKLVKGMDGRVRGRFLALEQNKGWPARVTMFLLRHPSLGFILVVILVALWLWIVNR